MPIFTSLSAEAGSVGEALLRAEVWWLSQREALCGYWSYELNVPPLMEYRFHWKL